MLDLLPAVIAGLVGGAAMMVILYLGMAIMPEQMKMNQLRLLGTMMLPDGAAAYVGGGMIHAIMSVIFALIHIAIYNALGLGSNLMLWGLAFGVVHWMAAGIAMGMMPMMHSGIKHGTIGAPGIFASAYPVVTSAGFLLLHLVFGVVVAAIYGALI